jgi:hypothetical protein
LKALYDRFGKAVAFLGDNRRILDLRGGSLAWINGSGSVYDYSGRHMGWWQDGHMRDRNGAVSMFLPEATNLGVIPPIVSIPPIPPIPSIEPIRPIPAIPPIKPINRMSWAS